MNITLTSIEYQLADARLLAVDGHQHLPVNAPTLRPRLRPSLNAGGISTAATRSTASISPFGVHGQVDPITGVLTNHAPGTLENTDRNKASA